MTSWPGLRCCERTAPGSCPTSLPRARSEDPCVPTPLRDSDVRRLRRAVRVAGLLRPDHRLVVVSRDRVPDRLHSRADHPAAPLPGRGRPDRRRALPESAGRATGPRPRPGRTPVGPDGAAAGPHGGASPSESAGFAGPGPDGRLRRHPGLGPGAAGDLPDAIRDQGSGLFARHRILCLHAARSLHRDRVADHARRPQPFPGRSPLLVARRHRAGPPAARDRADRGPALGHPAGGAVPPHRPPAVGGGDPQSPLFNHRPTDRRQLHRPARPAAGTANHGGARGPRRCRRPDRRPAAAAGPLRTPGDRGLRGCGLRRPRPLPPGDAELRRGADRADPRDALPPASHRRHPPGVGAGQRGDPRAGRRGRSHAGRHPGQRPDHRECAALGPGPAAADLRAAPGDPHLLRFRLRGRRPLLDRREIPAGPALAAGAQRRVAADPDLHQRAPDVHPRDGPHPGPRQPGDQRRPAGAVHQGSAAGLDRVAQDHAAADLLRRARQRVRLRAHAAAGVRPSLRRDERLRRLRRHRRRPGRQPPAPPSVRRPIRLLEDPVLAGHHQRQPGALLPRHHGPGAHGAAVPPVRSRSLSRDRGRRQRSSGSSMPTPPRTAIRMPSVSPTARPTCGTASSSSSTRTTGR